MVERGDHIALDREAANDAANVGGQLSSPSVITSCTRFHASPPWPAFA